MRRGREDEEQLVGGALRTHTALIKFAVSCGSGSWDSKAITRLISKTSIIEHCNKIIMI